MMSDQVYGFIEGLIRKTDRGELQWELFTTCRIKNEIISEIRNGRADFDPNVNSIRENSSYYLEYDGGYVFLFSVYHGDADVTSPEFDTESIMVKINDVLPLMDLSSYYEDEQKKLSQLRLIVENYLETRYPLPDTLYDFMNKIVGDK